ncbi:hypothetical protein DSO57_1020026 [Entomophthora muscae]|uniref:Uncharacterized protein n=1 Tax=Entomophthora muscae TaxID=34485 RepID=A0ACC2RIM2_9FUNG|nr:hypothetical protein DSO57_1020026 [Entomophthora muscae]
MQPASVPPPVALWLSPYAIGDILAQLDNEGVDHPIAYTFCVLNKHEKNYSVKEKECLVVPHAVK